MARNGRRVWDDPKYRERRAQLMASITPLTRCWRCGKLAREHPQFHKSGRRATWQAGHLVDGDNRAAIALEWSVCNQGAGAALGHRRAFGQYREAAERPAVGPHYPGHYSANPQDLTAAPCLRAHGSLCDVCREWHARNPSQRG
jgi:hypothetical protein